LEAENADLKAQLNQPVKTSENSSLPPSTQMKSLISTPPLSGTNRRRGGKSRCRQMADVVVECQPEMCQQCGADLSTSQRQEIGRQQVIELPPIRAVVMDLVRASYPVT
jgi:transposase